MEGQQSAEYKEWVLFVRHNDRGSIEALKAAVVIENSVLIRDVDSMAQRPEWLVAVPTLLHATTKQKYEGSAAIGKLAHAASAEPLPYDNMVKSHFSFGEGDKWGGPVRTTDFILPVLEEDERYRGTLAVTPEAFAQLQSHGGGAIGWK